MPATVKPENDMKRPIVLIAFVAFATGASAQMIDFEGFAAGTVMTEQYAGIGIHISVLNFTGPDKAIIFDSANPTGGDSDLATPGYHSSNTVPLGMILIIAENDVDSNNDGLVDVPDDEGSRPAGWLRFDMDFLSTGGSVTLIDIEEQGGTIDFFIGGGNSAIQTIGIPSIADNSVQTLTFDGFTYDAMQVNLAGSGAVASINPVPEPATLFALGTGAALLLRRRKARA